MPTRASADSHALSFVDRLDPSSAWLTIPNPTSLSAWATVRTSNTGARYPAASTPPNASPFPRPSTTSRPAMNVTVAVAPRSESALTPSIKPVSAMVARRAGVSVGRINAASPPCSVSSAIPTASSQRSPDGTRSVRAGTANAASPLPTRYWARVRGREK